MRTGTGLVGNAADVQRAFTEAPVIIVALKSDCAWWRQRCVPCAHSPTAGIGYRAGDFVPEPGQDFLEHFKRGLCDGRAGPSKGMAHSGGHRRFGECR